MKIPNKSFLIDKCKKIISEDENIFFMSDLVIELGISINTFNVHLPVKDPDREIILNLLATNKLNQKKKIRKKWASARSTNAQYYLYRLIATPAERGALCVNSVLNENEDEVKQRPKIVIKKTDGTTKEIG